MRDATAGVDRPAGVAARSDGAGSALLGMTPDGREALLARYRELVLERLPALAAHGGWVVTQDHCFGRIVLDAAVGRCWYDVLDRRRSPAYLQLSDDQLARAVDVAERLLVEGDPLLRRLDAASLAWRGKRPKPA